MCDGVTMILGAGAVSKIPSLSSHTVTDKVFAGCRGLFSKSRPVSPVGSVGASAN